MKYSIFIPHIQKEISKERIKLELGYHLLGEIESIDLITTHHAYNKAFVHYNNWNINDPKAQDIKNRLDCGYFCNIYVMSINKYWKLLKNKTSKSSNNSPFELTIRKPTLSDRSSGPGTSSIFGDLIKLDNDLSLFERIVGNDNDKNSKFNNNNNEASKIQKLEDRITKLENYIYNRIV